MISFEEAVERVRAAAVPARIETVAVGEAAARVLAQPVIARIDSPRSDVSAMDGYAVRDADLARLPARLRVAARSFAGAGWDGALEDGECARIFTGAPMPAGADRVVIQEEVTRDGDFAVIAKPVGTARHVRPRASDFGEGDELLPSGRLLDRRAIVAAAAADLAKVQVFTRPRVRILSTGDELAEPGSASACRDSIPDSVSLGVAELAREWGADVVGRKRLRDDLAEMRAHASRAVTGAELVIVTGGASVGEKDFAKTMFEPAGLDLIFSKVSLKPGKPVWLGRAGGALVLGLPGNPTSAMVTARLLLAPLIAGLSGRDVREALQWRRAPLASPLGPAGPRETFHRGRWSGEKVDILDFQDSSAQKALTSADVLVRQPSGSSGLAIGEEAQVLDF